MTVPAEVFQGNEDFLNRAILAAYRGSIAHGMYVPPKEPTSIDDKDLMYVIVPTIDNYFGLNSWGSTGTKEIKKNEWDIVGYEVTKFIRLLSQGNPNVLSMLWLEKNFYTKMTGVGSLLIANRDLFVGKHVYHSFVGYAHSQLHKMTHNAFQGHMGEKRRTLVEKFGYDTKNAAHLIRLLRMGIEFLNDGVMRVLREDATQLLEIKRGEWPLDKVLAEADELFKLARGTYVKSSLPASPNKDAINELCVLIVKDSLRNMRDV